MSHRSIPHRVVRAAPPASRSGPAAPHALVMRRVHRDWVAGWGGCTARVRALRGVRLRVRFGEIVGIAGSAGAGKTTLLLCAAGLLRVDAGSVTRGASWVRYLAPEPQAACRLAALAGLPPGTASVSTPVLGAGVAERADDGAGLILVDELPLDGLGALGEVLRRRAAAGDALVVASRDVRALACVGARPWVLANGVLVARGAAARDQRRKREAARSMASSPDARAAASMRSTCGRRLRSPQ